MKSASYRSCSRRKRILQGSKDFENWSLQINNQLKNQYYSSAIDWKSKITVECWIEKHPLQRLGFLRMLFLDLHWHSLGVHHRGKNGRFDCYCMLLRRMALIPFGYDSFCLDFFWLWFLFAYDFICLWFLSFLVSSDLDSFYIRTFKCASRLWCFGLLNLERRSS